MVLRMFWAVLFANAWWHVASDAVDSCPLPAGDQTHLAAEPIEESLSLHEDLHEDEKNTLLQVNSKRSRPNHTTATPPTSATSASLATSATSAASAAGTPTCDPEYANWMKEFQDSPIKDLTLLGSHDAGCVQGQVSAITGLVAWFASDEDAVTQTKPLFQQLCSGYRVFDIRFMEREGKWMIHHGPLKGVFGGFFFESMDHVAQEFGSFCASHTTELTIIRIKMESGTNPEKLMAIKLFADLIEGVGKCSVLRGADGEKFAQTSFTPYTIAELKGNASADSGLVAFMVYKMDKWIEGGSIEELTSDQDFIQLAYNYSYIQEGKYSDSKTVKGVFNSVGVLGGTTPQYERCADWKERAQTDSHLTFGFWMTLTYGNILEKARTKLFDNGKYSGWVKQVIEHYAGSNMDMMRGWTIWMDFAGDEGLQSVPKAILQLNQGLLKTPPKSNCTPVDDCKSKLKCCLPFDDKDNGTCLE
mmetsp:Transcript_73649/g.158016  ORF Transcript_73649/g.158016 Transcript_73649/m.158016 type:complete len:474 (-) Transcript_73649:92-1513(-)